MNIAEQIIILIGLLIGGAIATVVGLVPDWETYKIIAALLIAVFAVGKITLSL
ncbi:hypothetical protein [Thiothrix winogradskyi]|uniref:Uncharacterized protein n=1 Tax=Thiothrix winogradskyi TaxID=96472 RepID=A0ABY3T6L8_9GAMM|nr:hypothetical protein [Thiothrix winogradskyi]UJS26246.1 hypothetical protein L2Y54_09465 [Thiothrix winogradskyi]